MEAAGQRCLPSLSCVKITKPESIPRQTKVAFLPPPSRKKLWAKQASGEIKLSVFN